MESIKCVIIGDGAVGKTCLVESYVTKSFPEQSPPGPYNFSKCSFTVPVTVEGGSVSLDLWDAPGGEEYDRLIARIYPQTHVFLICFSVANPCSLMNVQAKWYPNATKHCPGAPVILVGLKRELRDDQETIDKLKERGQSPITNAQGSELAEKLNAWKYLECSARTLSELDLIFDEAVRAALAALASKVKKRSGKKKCTLM